MDTGYVARFFELFALIAEHHEDVCSKRCRPRHTAGGMRDTLPAVHVPNPAVMFHIFSIVPRGSPPLSAQSRGSRRRP